MRGKAPGTRHQAPIPKNGYWGLGFGDSLVLGAWCLVLFATASSSFAQEKITYQDHVLPLVETHCSKCHNPDKLKGDLDLTSFNGVMKGGGSGQVVLSGNPDASKLWKAITHAEDPTMPPNKAKLPDKDLDVFRKWIAGGLLENSGSKAIVANKGAMDLTLKAGAIGKPEGPPPMPKEFALDSVIHTSRGNPITGLAASPWAPLVAIAGLKQIILYNTDNLELLGILPFTNGQPVELKFSRNGKFLISSGGHGAKSGKVVVWDITTGERVTVIGEEQDTVIAADMSPDQSKIALGGPSRFVKIYSTQSGEMLHKIKKHTDWVTAIAFSPNGEYLASADRNGGISVWDPDNGQELFTLAGHKSFVTGLSWRDDSKLLASSSEDGTIKWWEMAEGKQAKTWNAHGGGALAVSFTHDGKLVSCGRDNAVTFWNADGNKAKSFEFFGEMPLRAVLSHNSERAVATDFTGRVAVWNTKDGKRLGELGANPLPLSERLKLAEQRVKDLAQESAKPFAELIAAEAQLAKVQAAFTNATAALEKAKADQKAKEDEVVKLKQEASKPPPGLLTQVYPPPPIDKKLAEAREARGKAREATTNAVAAVEAKQKEVDAAQGKLKEVKARDPKLLLASAKEELSKIKAAIAQSDLFRARVGLSSLKREAENLKAFVTEKSAELKELSAKVDSTEDAEQKTKLKATIKELSENLKQAEDSAKKVAAEIASQQKRVGSLSAEFQRSKTASST